MRSGSLIALALAGLTLAVLGVWGPGGGPTLERDEAWSGTARHGHDRSGRAGHRSGAVTPGERIAARGGRFRDQGRTRAAIAALRGAVDAAPGLARRARVTLGESARGRPIRATAANGRGPGPLLLVVGCIHGTECAGTEVVRALARGGPPAGAGVVAVPNLNPDGRSLAVRTNARGVDLNRNFASDWRPIGTPGDPQHSGAGPLSEPETRLARRLIRGLRPEVTIWFHQQLEPLVRAWGPSVRPARAYARLAGTTFHRLPWLDGTAPNWQHARFPRTSSFVVELALGEPTPGVVARHARAIAKLPERLRRGAHERRRPRSPAPPSRAGRSPSLGP